MAINFIPGTRATEGYDIDGDGKVDVTLAELAAANAVRPKRGNEVRHLNEYTGYFETSDGDFPVSCVASNMVEAARILSKPGIYGGESMEPKSIKFTKQTIAVAVPTRNVGFKTTVYPDGAAECGAIALPEVSTVENGTSVIFETKVPFGWDFVGWSVGTPVAKGGTVISTDLRTTIEVWDQSATILEYYANYSFNPTLRNGRYQDIDRGSVWNMKFDGYGNYAGRIDVLNGVMGDYFFVIDSLDKSESDGVLVGGTMTLKKNSAISQPQDVAMTANFTLNATGMTIAVTAITADNILGFTEDTVINLRFMTDAGYGSSASSTSYAADTTTTE